VNEYVYRPYSHDYLIITVEYRSYTSSYKSHRVSIRVHWFWLFWENGECWYWYWLSILNLKSSFKKAFFILLNYLIYNLKSADKTHKIKFWKIPRRVKKTAEFCTDLNLLKTLEKCYSKKVIIWRILLSWIWMNMNYEKNWKFPSLFIKNVFREIFCNFFNCFEISVKFFVYETLTEMFHKYLFLALISGFLKLFSKTRPEGLKAQEKCFWINVS